MDKFSIEDYMNEYGIDTSLECSGYNNALMEEISDYIGETEDVDELCDELSRYLEDVYGYEENDIEETINNWKECYDYNWSYYSDFNYSFRDFVLQQMVSEFGFDESEYEYEMS